MQVHKDQDKTFIITLHSSQDLPQCVHTVENLFLNPWTARKICALQILKEPLLDLSGRKITEKPKNVCTINYYMWHQHLLSI